MLCKIHFLRSHYQRWFRPDTSMIDEMKLQIASRLTYRFLRFLRTSAAARKFFQRFSMVCNSSGLEKDIFPFVAPVPALAKRSNLKERRIGQLSAG